MAEPRCEERELAEFQAALLEVLGSGLSAEAMLESLSRHPAAESFRDYLDSFEPRMLAVAAELVAKWGVRR